MKDSIYFDEASHRYFVNGNETDGVSALLESAGIVTTRFFKPQHAHRGQVRQAPGLEFHPKNIHG